MNKRPHRSEIFLSGVSHELASFRDAVENEVLTKGCFPLNQPSFEPDYRTIEAMLRDKLAQADVMIHIVGFRFGAEPSQPPAHAARRSYTQREFDIARELGKPVYVFLSQDASVRDAPKPDERPEDADASALQLAHRQTVQQGDHIYYFFPDQATLRRLVAQIPLVAAASFQADITRIIKYAPERLIGRDDELALLDQAWSQVRHAESPRPRVISFVALGGEGKTSLVAKWAADLAHDNWPGCDAVFAWSFYSQGTREQTAASSDLFLAEALQFFGDAALAHSSASAFDKARRLAQLVGQQRALLILDGVEPLQYAPTSPTPGELKDQALAALLKALATNSQGLCVLTTRYAIPDLRAFWQTTAPQIELKRLSNAAGVALLQSLGVTGAPPEFEKLVEDVHGHALTLNLLGSYLQAAHGGDIRQRDRVTLEEADDESEHGGHAFRVMDAYVAWFATSGPKAKDVQRGQRALAVLQLLGLFDRPASADCLAALLKAPAIPHLTESFTGLTEAQRNLVFDRLEKAKLLTVNRNAAGQLLALDAHPLLREYFAKQLRTQQPEAWRAAHQRIFEHLCATTKEGKQPSMEELQPLYQAVTHGCLAGLQQRACAEVYRDRILRGDEKYSMKKLGAFGSDLGTIAYFFEVLWSQVSPNLNESIQAWLLGHVAFSLHALGRLLEALEPMRAGLKMSIKLKHSKSAAANALNLSELELTLGELSAALEYIEQSQGYAEKTGNWNMQMFCGTSHANLLHQADRLTKADELFCEAEALQAKMQHEYPLLYSRSGFQYCDRLLAATERSAWRVYLQRGAQAMHVEVLGDVEHRARQSLQWISDQNWLLDIALNRLTLGQVALYTALLQNIIPGSASPVLATNNQAASEIKQAVDGLRRAGTQDNIPRALLTRAWLRCLQENPTGLDSAQTDLDEAWEIAERGPMPLHQADIHLHRARLFFREPDYPWNQHTDGSPRGPKHDLSEARRLIEKHGYGRRKEELEDAEAALRDWQAPATGPATATRE